MRKLSALRLLPLTMTLLLAGTAQNQPVTTPRTPSPAASVSQTIGISTVRVDYSRPSVRGREIWGSLVPYGWNVQSFGLGNSAPWRAGANENTVLHLSNNAKIEGNPVPAGDYGLFFVINKDNTGEVILSKDYRSWGSFFYEADHDELRSPIQIRDCEPTEMLTYDFINLTKNSGELVLNWEKKQFPVKIEFDVDNIVMNNADQELKGATGFDYRGFQSAANYALQNKTHLEQGLEWADKAASMRDNFTTQFVKAQILSELGKKEEADKTMAGAIEKANEAEVNNYGYQLLNAGDKDKAIEMFLLNTKRHPESANVWDSLGEGYATRGAKGDKEKAIANFKKSLSLNPPPNVKANSEKYLAQLGAM